MSLPKKVWKKSRFEKGLGNLNAEGMVWWLQNIDLEKTPPYLRVSHKMFKNLDQSINAELNSMPIDGALFGKNMGGLQIYNWMVTQGWGNTAKFFRYEYPNWVYVHSYYFPGGRAYSLLGDSTFWTPGLGGTEQGYLYFTVGNSLGRYDASTNSWNDAWQSLGSGVLYSNGNVPLTKFLKYIIAGFNNMLCAWDTVNLTWHGNPNPPKITLPPNFDIRWFAVLTDWLVIGAYDLTSNGSALFFWDGISGTYNRVLRIPNVSCPAGVVDKNRLYVITGDGWINFFDGSGLQKLNRFPDIESGDISFFVNQNAVKVHNGVILIGVKAHGFNMEKRYYAGGIWVFNPATNALYFRNTLSHGGITNISGTGVIQVGSIQLTLNSDQFFVGWDKGDTNRYLLDVNHQEGSYRPYNWNATVVSPVFDDEPYRRKRFIQEVLNFWKPLIDTPFARYVVKYNTTEKYQKYATFVASGTSTYFNLSFGIANFEVGDEVTVIAGSGAGQIRHVASIDTSLNRVYVDETLYNSENGNEYNNTSYILVTPFKKAGVIKGNENKSAVNKLVRFNARAKKIQIKIDIWSPSGFVGEWDMGIRDMSTIYIPDRTIK